MSDDEKPAAEPTTELTMGQLKIRVPADVAGGTYSNLVLVNHSPDDFVMDFCFVEPGTQQASVRARVIVSPSHMKRLLGALQTNLQRYEENFGAIAELKPAPPSPPSGTVN